MFLSYNMFFILDEAKKLDIIRDEGRHITYAVLDVVKPRENRLSSSISDGELSSSDDLEEVEK